MSGNLSSQTVTIARMGTDLEKMVKVFQDLEMLSVGATRQSRAYDPKSPALTPQDHEAFLNNLPGLIAVFKAVELQLMKERVFPPFVGNMRIRRILHEIIEIGQITEQQIRDNPKIFYQLVVDKPEWADRITLANATWATRATTRIESDGARLKRVGRVNSITMLITPHLLPGESDEDRISRLTEVGKDIDQLSTAAQWWLDLLVDPDRMVDELNQIRTLIAK